MITKNPKTILIADDNAFFITKMSEILVDAGHRVRYAFDGRGAINKLKTSLYETDLLMLDLDMPHVDGFGVLEWLKENGAAGRFPVLVVTGDFEISECIDRVRGLGAAGIITKDFTPEQIVFRVNRLLFPEKNENKVATRVPVSVCAEVMAGSAVYPGFVRNISSTGVFLHTRGDLPSGSVIQLRFTLAERSFDLKGIVKWSTESDEKNSYFRGSGIMFAGVPSEDQGALNNFISSEARKLGIEG